MFAIHRLWSNCLRHAPYGHAVPAQQNNQRPARHATGQGASLDRNKPRARRINAAHCLGVCLALASAGAFASNTSHTVIGTLSTANAKFVGVINANLSAPTGMSRLAGLRDFEMQDLADAVTRESHGNPWTTYSIIAAHSSVQAARFHNAAAIAMAGWSGANVKIQQRIHLDLLPGLIGNPHLDMTIQEIYLDFRTAPGAALSPEAAMVSTAAEVATGVGAAAIAGYEFGTAMQWLINNYCPELNNKVGQAMDTILNLMITYSASPLFEGREQEDLLNLFDIPAWEITSSTEAATGDIGAWGTFDDLSLAGNLCVNPGGCQ